MRRTLCLALFLALGTVAVVQGEGAEDKPAPPPAKEKAVAAPAVPLKVKAVPVLPAPPAAPAVAAPVVAVPAAPVPAKPEKATPAAPATAPTEKPIPPAVIEKLVEQLGDRDFHKRDQAGRQLESLGPRVLPGLRKARVNADPEVRRRLDDLIPALETSAVIAPKRITFKATKKPLKDIIDEITRQTGYKVEFFGGSPEQQVLTLDFDKVPFWDALDRICEQTGMVLQQGWGGDDRLRLQTQDSYVPHLYREGPFRVVANSFNYTRNIDFTTRPKAPTANQPSESLMFNFMVFVEPKLPLLNLGTVKLVEAYDENHISMLPPAGNDDGNQWQHRYYRGYGNQHCYCQQANINLTPTSEKSRVVKYIKGSVPVTLLAEQKPEVVTDKILTGTGRKAKFGTTSIKVEEVTETQASKQYQVRMTVNEEGKENDWNWMNTLYQRIEMQDEKGNKFQTYGTSFGGNGAGGMQVTFTYGHSGGPKMGVPTKLIFYAWTMIQYQVNFEFKDLPLP